MTGGGIHEEGEGGHHGRPSKDGGTEFFSNLNRKRSFLKSFDLDMSSVEIFIEVCSFLSRYMVVYTLDSILHCIVYCVVSGVASGAHTEHYTTLCSDSVHSGVHTQHDTVLCSD